MEEPSPEQPVVREETANQPDEEQTPRGGEESTTPRGNPEPDEDAIREGTDRLDQAGGGH